MRGTPKLYVNPQCQNPQTPKGSIYTTIMELGPQNHNGDGRLGPNSIIVVYMDPLGPNSFAKLGPSRFQGQLPGSN